jgi:hypothetical protein
MLFVVSTGPGDAPPPNAPDNELRKWTAEQWRRAQLQAAIESRARHVPVAPEVPCSINEGILGWQSRLTLIDVERRAPVAEVDLCGYVGPAAANNDGAVFAAVVDTGQILRIDVPAILELAKAGAKGLGGADLRDFHPTFSEGILHLTWPYRAPYESRGAQLQSGFDGLKAISACNRPSALAVDSKDDRLFAACGLGLAVLKGGTGGRLGTINMNSEIDDVGYDPDRDFIFAASGGGEANLTIVQRDRQDTYHIIQTLPTREQARKLAVNPSTGQVYLVTVYQVAKVGMAPPMRLTPDDSSFQVLVVGN